MLGLGDVVLPGIVIGLALRFDLYLFYLRRQKTIPATAESPENIEKPQYFPLAGRWSDHFWTHSLTGRPLWTSSQQALSKPEAPFTFPKTYFKASLVGYILGLLATLGVMIVWNHAQPALLYLVPGVLGSIWLTALVRGELSLMWNYTEEVEEEAESEKKADSQTKGTDIKSSTESKSGGSATVSDAKVNPSSKRTTGYRGDREFFSFSIHAPWPLKSSRSTDSSSRTDTTNSTTQPESTEHNWVPAKPPGKRLRLK
jgi:minor histocompatibility antigen H13